jgi:hypothetical protein
MLPLLQDGLLLQGRIFLGLDLYWVYFPFLSLVDMLRAFDGRFGSQWFHFLQGGPPLSGLDFGPCPLFLFLFFLPWVLSFL